MGLMTSRRKSMTMISALLAALGVKWTSLFLKWSRSAWNSDDRVKGDRMSMILMLGDVAALLICATSCWLALAVALSCLQGDGPSHHLFRFVYRLRESFSRLWHGVG